MARLRFQPLDYAAAAAFTVYASSVTATPICLVVLSREISFSLSDGGLLEGLRSTLVILTLLFSGFIAARFGKVRVLGASGLLLAAALALYTVAPSYAVLLFALGLMGMGGGAIEALLNPLVEELHRDEAGRYLNFINAFWSVGVFITVLLTGELLTRGVSWRYIIGGLAGLSVFTGVLFLLLRRTSPPREPQSMGEVFRHKQGLLRSARFWHFNAMMFFAGAAEGALTFWSATFIQLQHNGLPRAAGIGVATFAAGMVLGRIISGVYLHTRRLRAGILGSALAGVLISGTLPLVDSIHAVWGVLFFAGLAVACFWPSIQAYAVDVLPHDSTSLFILLSCGGIAGFGFASWLIGVLAEQFGFTAAFFAIPAAFLVLAGLLVWPRVQTR